jgi:hypothetical protein
MDRRGRQGRLQSSMRMMRAMSRLGKGVEQRGEEEIPFGVASE